ncbi:DUF2938 family protein [Thioclava kandeliae]|uniref:DUF2938 family protein n=1 Tax=Thioclava kandeliae TaxID=3070818 RepID=A0ABV1SNF8_9RHOB
MASEILRFIVVVGIASTLLLDLSAQLMARLAGKTPTNWGNVGLWLRGMARGRWVFVSSAAPTGADHALGWAFHYFVGIAYAASYPLIWGGGIVETSRFWPFLVIGLGLTTCAGLCLMVPGMGGGFLGRGVPDRAGLLKGMLMAHLVFALGEYATACLLA